MVFTWKQFQCESCEYPRYKYLLLFCTMSLKIILLKLLPYLPGANEFIKILLQPLTIQEHVYIMWSVLPWWHQSNSFSALSRPFQDSKRDVSALSTQECKMHCWGGDRNKKTILDFFSITNMPFWALIDRKQVIGYPAAVFLIAEAGWHCRKQCSHWKQATFLHVYFMPL